MVNVLKTAVPSASLAITKVVDSTGELSNPGTTSDTELKLSGTSAEKGVVVIMTTARPLALLRS
jgi:hypothetical protein